MGGSERELLLQAFDSNWIAPLGPHVDGFEAELAPAVGMKHVAALASGTSALHLALRLLNVGAGDEVFVSTLTFAASATPIFYEGATPVFVDSERTSWNMDPALLEEELAAAHKRGKLPKAVIAVDLYGQTCDYERIAAACGRFDVPLIEDAAEALGSLHRGRPAGSYGLMSVLSFNGNKIITTSGGGALASNRPELIERARFLATQARDPAPHYEHSTLGYNYRLSNLLAAVGRGQLKVLADRVAARRANHAFYREALAGLPGVSMLLEAPWCTWNCWLSCIQVDPDVAGFSREDLRLALDKHDIEARPVWKPMHLQHVFKGCPHRGGDVARELFDRGLCLPSGSSLAAEDRARVASIIHDVAKARG
jgi:pyridoxal phosphate-dependent aminotransferase EpsN